VCLKCVCWNLYIIKSNCTKDNIVKIGWTCERGGGTLQQRIYIKGQQHDIVDENKSTQELNGQVCRRNIPPWNGL